MATLLFTLGKGFNMNVMSCFFGSIYTLDGIDIAVVSGVCALVISVSIKIVGALLVSSLLTIPVACSLVVGRSFRPSVGMAVFFSETAVIIGLVSAGIRDLAPGAAIVLTLIALLIAAFIFRMISRRR